MGADATMTDSEKLVRASPPHGIRLPLHIDYHVAAAGVAVVGHDQECLECVTEAS